MKLRTVHTPTEGRSQESSAMGESLTERLRVDDEVLRAVKTIYEGDSEYHIACDTKCNIKHEKRKITSLKFKKNEIF